MNLGGMLLLLLLHCPQDHQYLVREPAAEHWAAYVQPALR